MTMSVLEVKGVTKRYSLGKRFFGASRQIVALDDVSFAIGEKEVVGLVGESGCGKSTLAQIIMGLLEPTRGSVSLSGEKVQEMDRVRRAKTIQPIFQDPFSSLNPRKTVFEILLLPLKVLSSLGSTESQRLVFETANLVGLSRQQLARYPNQLSGGQRQRVAIGRALISRPSIVVCDEPTSALDVSVQAQILNLLLDLQRELNVSYLFITHNLSVVEHMASRILVMQKGKIVEAAETAELFSAPRHPYTQALLRATLPLDPRERRFGNALAG